jgi:hypothetical protein
VSKTLLGDHDDGRVFDFSMGSTFRAIGQSPARNALVSEIRRDCKGSRRESGTGREGSKYGIEDFLEVKSLCIGDIYRRALDPPRAGEMRSS